MIESNTMGQKKVVQDDATCLMILYSIIVIISWKPKEQ